MRRRFLLLSNRHAGVGGSTLVEATKGRLRMSGAVVDHRQPPSVQVAREHAMEAAQSGSCDAVIAAGGDGTIRQVAAGLVDTDMPLALIPVGTGNVLAHEIGVAANAEAISEMLLQGPCRRVHVARANGAPFLLMASAGLDARVVGALDQRLKSRIGRVAYAGPIFGALARPMDHLTVTIDGKSHEASWVVFANAAHYAGAFVLTPRTDITRPELQAVLFKARNRAVLMSQLMSLSRGRLSERCVDKGDIEMLSCLQGTITSPRPVPAQLDGDVFGLTPLSVEAAVGQLMLVVPNSRAP